MKKIHSAFAPFLGILLLLAVWFLLCRAEIFSPYLLPTPQKVFDSFLRMLFSGELLRDVLISFIRILKGFCIAFLLAFLLGMFRTLLPAAEKYYDAIVQFFRNVPPLSLIPLLILWCGIGETTKTVIIVLASFFPMYLNIVKALRAVTKGYWRLGMPSATQNLKNSAISSCPMPPPIFSLECASAWAIAGVPSSRQK